jgi:hypothetical protein
MFYVYIACLLARESGACSSLWVWAVLYNVREIHERLVFPAPQSCKPAHGKVTSYS